MLAPCFFADLEASYGIMLLCCRILHPSGLQGLPYGTPRSRLEVLVKSSYASVPTLIPTPQMPPARTVWGGAEGGEEDSVNLGMG